MGQEVYFNTNTENFSYNSITSTTDKAKFVLVARLLLSLSFIFNISVSQAQNTAKKKAVILTDSARKAHAKIRQAKAIVGIAKPGTPALAPIPSGVAPEEPMVELKPTIKAEPDDVNTSEPADPNNNQIKDIANKTSKDSLSERRKNRRK